MTNEDLQDLQDLIERVRAYLPSEGDLGIMLEEAAELFFPCCPERSESKIVHINYNITDYADNGAYLDSAMFLLENMRCGNLLDRITFDGTLWNVIGYVHNHGNPKAISYSSAELAHAIFAVALLAESHLNEHQGTESK